MVTTLATYTTLLVTDAGRTYTARSVGAELSSNLWEGWIEFVSDDGSLLRTGRETTQPNLTDLEYWATGVTPVYLEGALERALAGPHPVGPAASAPAIVSHPVLDPFEAYAKGPDRLRQQLRALSPAHLRAIIRAYGLADDADPVVDVLGAQHLTTVILAGIRARLAA